MGILEKIADIEAEVLCVVGGHPVHLVGVLMI